MSSLLDDGQDFVAVPELIVKFYSLFPEVLPRAQADHIADTDGLCRSCFQAWPCEIQQWVHTLSLRRPSGLHARAVRASG